MTSVLFFAMLTALVLGASCFALACFLDFHEGRRRLAFFAASVLGFWAACVVQLSGQIGDLFVTLQTGMEESVHNAFLRHWQAAGHVTLVSGQARSDGAPSRLCTAGDLASSGMPDCRLAQGVNSAAVCRQWVLYVPFLLPYLRPCPALRTNGEVMNDPLAREALVDAIREPCRYAPTGLDYKSARIRKALGCNGVSGTDKVMLLVDRPDGPQTLMMERGP